MATMAPPAPLRYANEIRSPDLDPAYTSPATPARRRRPRAADQKPAAGDAVAQAPQQPDIEWIPSFKSYRDRNLRRLRNGGLKQTLPEGFPTKLESPLAWEGDELREEEYIVELSALEIEETEEALRDFKSKGISISCISRQNFVLPTLGPRLIALGATLYYGRGFFVLRGLEPQKYSSEDNVLIYVGLSSYVAEKRGRQDEHNNMLLHLIDLTSEVAPDNLRQAPYSNVQQPYHTDIGDILALYTLSQAKKGGKSKITSSWTIYNDLAESRPDHIDTLQSPDWIFDTFGRPGEPYYQRPLLFNQAGKMIFAFSRRILTGSKVSPRSKTIPPMTDAQADALDALHFTAEKHSLTLDNKRGDILFWNNMSILHAREGFTDGTSRDQKRHLLRLWLRSEEHAWETPDCLKSAWNVAYGDNDISTELWPIEPITDRDHVTTQRRSSGHG